MFYFIMFILVIFLVSGVIKKFILVVNCLFLVFIFLSLIFMFLMFLVNLLILVYKVNSLDIELGKLMGFFLMGLYFFKGMWVLMDFLDKVDWIM